MKQLITVLLFVMVAMATNAQTNVACPKHIDGDSLKTAPVYFYYKQYYKKKDFEKAYPYWRTLYDKASGFSSIIFYEGEEILQDKIAKLSADKTTQAKYVDTLMELYDRWIKCYGNEDFILGTKKAQALVEHKGDLTAAKACLEKSLSISTRYPLAIKTYFNIINYEYKEGKVSDAVLTQKHDALVAMCDKEIAKNDQYAKLFVDAKATIEENYTKNFSDKTDPTDCQKLLEIYTKKYQANPNDAATVEQVYTKTKGCADSALNVELLQKLNQLKPNYSYAVRLAKIYMNAGKKEEAFVLYQNAINYEKDSSKIADLYLLLANLESDKDKFTEAREYARQALSYQPTNARAYLLIGYLYASSGKLCGPGTGFQSQIVLWPAFDYFKKAVEYGDEEIKTEATKLLTTYKQYLPTKADITAKKLTVGAPYTIKCWINETTTVQIK